MPCDESDLSSSPWYVNAIGDNVCGTLTEDTLVTSEQSLRLKEIILEKGNRFYKGG